MSLHTPAKRARRPRKVTVERWVAYETVRRTFDEQAYTDRVFDAVAGRHELETRERALAQFLAYGTVQRAKRLDHVISHCGKRPLRKLDAPVLHALRLGMFQLLEADSVADHAAIDQTVELVRGVQGERAVAFANAVMRRAQVDGHTLLQRLDEASDDESRAAALSFPEWMIRRMREAFGDRGVRALAFQNGARAGASAGSEPTDGGGTPAATRTVFRCNTLAAPSDDTRARLGRADGVELTAPVPPVETLLPELAIVRGATGGADPLVRDGALVAQSAASALVAHVLAPRPGDRVADLCAAPGNKTTHIAALMENSGEIVACELHAHRCAALQATADRCGASIVTTICCDATTLDPADIGRFDRVLVDAPCSGLGVLARRPDSRWKRSEEDVASLVDLQHRLLQTAARLVRPGGYVVYSTCTLLPDENEGAVEWALAHTDLEGDPLPDEVGEFRLEDMPFAVRTWPHEHDTDGFFIARFRRGGEGS